MHACTHIKYHTLHNCLFTTVVTQRTMVVNMRNRRQNPSNSFIIHGVVTSLRKPACVHACTHIKYHTLHNCLFTTVVTQRTMAVNMRNRRQNTSNSFIIHGVVTSLRKPAPVRAHSEPCFLTLPELVTPLKGHSLPLRSCPATRSVPFERFGY